MTQIIKAYKITWGRTADEKITFIEEGKRKAENYMEYLPNATMEYVEVEVKVTDKMKKELQKVCQIIRDERGVERGRGNTGYPKPILSEDMKRKGTAVINCGGEWFAEEKTKSIANLVLENEAFKTFIETYEAKAFIEKERFGYHIRINF